MITSLGTAYDWLIREPRQGAWTARLTVDSSAELAVGAQIVIADAWAGVIASVTPRGGLAYLAVVGGANALHKQTQAHHYLGGASAASVLADLCGDAGERAGETPAGASLGAWRSRGLPLAAELDRLARAVTAGQWRVAPDGTVALGQASAPEQPTVAVTAPGDYQKFEAPAIPVLDVAAHDLAIYQRGSKIPTVALFPFIPPRPRFDPQVVGGKIESQSGAKVGVVLDDGTRLSDVPLFTVPGFEPSGVIGCRCLVLDLADDPTATVALCGVDGSVQELKLGGLNGRVLRHGDKISITGLTSSSGPVSATPAGTVIQLDPTVSFAPGEPGVGHSRVKA